MKATVKMEVFINFSPSGYIEETPPIVMEQILFDVNCGNHLYEYNEIFSLYIYIYIYIYIKQFKSLNKKI